MGIKLFVFNQLYITTHFNHNGNMSYIAHFQTHNTHITPIESTHYNLVYIQP